VLHDRLRDIPRELEKSFSFDNTVEGTKPAHFLPHIFVDACYIFWDKGSRKAKNDDQHHWYCCYSIGHIRIPISLPLQICLYLITFPRHYQLFPKRGHVTLNTYPSSVIYHVCNSRIRVSISIRSRNMKCSLSPIPKILLGSKI